MKPPLVTGLNLTDTATDLIVFKYLKQGSIRLTDHPDMTLAVYYRFKATAQQQIHMIKVGRNIIGNFADVNFVVFKGLTL